MTDDRRSHPSSAGGIDFAARLNYTMGQNNTVARHPLEVSA
jgi:hypothetical protein